MRSASLDSPPPSDEGIYKVRGIAWDPRVTLTMELQVVIADVPCMMPVVSVVDKVQFPQSAPDVWRSMAFQRSTVATINCTRTVPVLYVDWAEVLLHVVCCLCCGK